MSPEESLQIADEVLIAYRSKGLTDLESLILRESLAGKGYEKMHGYTSQYFKTEGAKLFKTLSEALGEKVGKKNFRHALGKRYQIKLQSDSTSSSEGQEIVEKVNWQELCQRMIPTELGANPLLSGDGVTLGLEDIRPLDLVERKERPKLNYDPSPENFQLALDDQEIPLSYNQLFERVLAECKSLNQQGKGIAITGEPGSGKTTLLCAIANWIVERDEYPLFISLQDLDGKLEDYVLETWLATAIHKRKVPEHLQDELIEQCNAGRVWLLLDGVDER